MHARQLVIRGSFFLFSIACGLLLTLSVSGVLRVHADTASSTSSNTAQLQNQIDDTNSQIKDLQIQIAKLQQQLTTTTAQKQTLQNAIAALNLNIQKLQKSITLTQAQIRQKDGQISTLNGTISTTTNAVEDTQRQVAESLRELSTHDTKSMLVTLLSDGTLSSFFDEATSLQALRSNLENKIEDLNTLKLKLISSKNAAVTQKQQLASLQQDLSQQQQGLAINKDTQNQLLIKTKNQETAYQAQIAQKKADEAKFENDLKDFESKLNLSFNSNTLPATGSGALQWPVDKVIITQYFGNTAFATQNPQVYSGHGHSGLDVGASPGTPIKAARAGVVLGTGNTDVTCPAASFGKWVFIKHDNGLSTLYAHLASFAVSKGQTVTTGQLVGYSDTTEIASFPSSSCRGKTYTMPVGDLSAYLNPLSYLPPVPGK
jgi:murein DD-endopeptidase MepM/ murein hydrolase activator NlpD